MTLHEPDVTLTDFGLALECALFVVLLARQTGNAEPLRNWFIAFFAATGFAAFLGAIAHGFVPDKQSLSHRYLWIGIFASIGTAAVASWSAGSLLILSGRARRAVMAFVFAAFAIYIAVVLAVSQSFAVAIIHYLPAAIFLLIAFAIARFRHCERFLSAGIAGVLLTFIAALVQQAGAGFPALYFNHNALYHLIQAIALLLIYLAARGLTRQIVP